jgi:type 1 glutamine amidotransferase
MKIATLFAAAVVFLSSNLAADEKSPPLKVSMFSGSEEYKSDNTLAAFKTFIEEKYNAACTLNSVTRLDDLPGLGQLDSCDAIVVFTRRLTLPPDQIKKIKKYCDAGKPIVGIRTASHAFQTWLDFDKVVLGGNYSDHWRQDRLAQVRIEAKAKDHPVLAGVQPFTTMGKLYKNPGIAPDVTLLLTAATEEYTEPVAWTRTHKGGRVFYTSLGVPADFESENFRRMLVNALFWTAKREVQRR